MTKETLKALKGSIRKWKMIVAGKIANMGRDDCPLCELFWRQREGGACAGCPVAEKTGKHVCSGTPYPHFDAVSYDGWARTKEQKAAARKELKFLQSLLPKRRAR